MLLVPHVGDFRGRAQIGVFTGSLLILLVITYLFVDWMQTRCAKSLVRVGLFWFVLTLLFEVGFGALCCRPFLAGCGLRLRYRARCASAVRTPRPDPRAFACKPIPKPQQTSGELGQRLLHDRTRHVRQAGSAGPGLETSASCGRCRGSAGSSRADRGRGPGR